MKITKFGQSCLLIEEEGVRILLDPGSFSTEQNSLTGLNIILITHDHQDHLDMDSLKAVLANNPDVKIFTNAEVKEKLDKEGIASTIVAHGETVTEKGITIEGVGEKHALLITGMPQIANVGFIVNSRFFYPGDALTLPGKPIEILALPAAAPWSKISEIIDYAAAMKPTIAFPVHDSIMANPGMMAGMMAQVLKGVGVEFMPVELDKAYEF